VIWYILDKMKKHQKIIIIAGPNGAGKTTFAREFLTREADCPEFINADLIAQGLSPFDPDKAAIAAAKLMLLEIKRKTEQKQSFSFETTLSGTNYLKAIKKWKKSGYYIKLIFLSLPSPQIAIARVRARVAQGGHDIPVEVVTRRFHAGLENFHVFYKGIVNSWVFYENSSTLPRIIDSGDNDEK